MLYSILLIFFSFTVKENCAVKNNVCKTWKAYFFPDNNPNCWYDPDVESDLPQTLKNHKIPFEVHTKITKDGYILNLYRMVRNNGEVVVLQPPMTGTGANYLKSGDSSLGFSLYNAGYDVWLAHPRGTFYSRYHKHLSENDALYWDFSFHEIALYDYPSMLELIHNVTHKFQYIVIGYSLSTNSQAVYVSLLAEHSKKYVKFMIAIGPTMYTNEAFPPPEFIDLDAARDFFFHIGRVTAMASYEQSKKDINKACNGHPFRRVCVIGMSRNGGGTPDNFDPTVVPRLLTNSPARVSLKTLDHFRQIIRSKHFRQYDYGIIGNLMRYNTNEPPDYPSNKILVPFYMIHGENDTSAPVEFVNRYYSEMSDIGRKYGKHMIKTYNHVDYLYAKNSKTELVDHILNFIRTH